MAQCLVTGGAGFIGSHLVEALLARGHSVRVFDDFTTGRLTNLNRLPVQVEVFWGSIGDSPTAREALAGVDWVFHQASSAEPARVADARRFFREMIEAGVRRVVAALPGNSGDFDPMGVSPPELPTVWLAYPTVLGPRFAPSTPSGRTLYRVFSAMLAGRRPALPAGGTVDVIDVADVVEANLQAAAEPGLEGNVYPVSTAGRVGWHDLVERLNRLLGTCLPPADAQEPGVPAAAADDPSDPPAESRFRTTIALERSLRRYLASREGDDPDAPASDRAVSPAALCVGPRR